MFEFTSNALWCYPNVKLEIRNLSLITSTAPIFLQFNYFRQNLEENVTFTFFFLVLPQISLVKYYETIKILMQIFVYFKLHFHNEGLDCEKIILRCFFATDLFYLHEKFQPSQSSPSHSFL